MNLPDSKRLDERVEDICKGLEQEYDLKDGLVYHYTTTQNFLQIIDSETFHLSDSNFTNDPVELKYGISSVANFFQGLKIDENDLTQKTVQEWFLGKHKAFTSPKYFIGCFSLHENDLNQWIKYADNAVGVRLAIDWRKLRDTISSDKRHVYPMMVYDSEWEEKLKTAYEKTVNIFNEIAEHFKQNQVTYSKDLSDDLALFVGKKLSHIATCIGILALSMKHEAYKSEKEVRILRLFTPHNSSDEEIKIKSSKHGITPYISLGFPRDCITEIMLGPRSTDAQRDMLNEVFTKRYNLKVTKSEIPYR